MNFAPLVLEKQKKEKGGELRALPYTSYYCVVMFDPPACGYFVQSPDGGVAARGFTFDVGKHIQLYGAERLKV